MLLSPEFIRELEVLKRRLDVQARSGLIGDLVGARRGSSAEFHDHRPYSPGDDLRRIDWFALARSGQPMLKQFQSNEDSIVRVVMDHSASMSFGAPSKFDTAKRIAGALAYLWQTSGQRFQLIAESGSRVRVYPARRGRRAVGRSFAELEALTTERETDLARSVQSLLRGGIRPGLIVALSDFFNPAPLLHVLDQARARGHQIALVQVLARDEIDPPFDGDLSLQDSETGDLVDVSMDPSALSAYFRRLEELSQSLSEWANNSGQRYHQMISDEDPVSAVVHVARRRERHVSRPGKRATSGNRGPETGLRQGR